ncbi:MAG: signal peptidase I [Lachnospiraceae bacterium]
MNRETFDSNEKSQLNNESETEELQLDFIEFDSDLNDYFLIDAKGRKKPVSSNTVTDTMAIRELKRKRFLREILSIVEIFAIAAVIAFIISFYVIVNSTVPTGSMSNTIRPGDHVIGMRLAYLFEEPDRGDIIIFPFPDNEEDTYVKRIIGLPGEKIEIKAGILYINDELYKEPYLKEPMRVADFGPYYVPDDCYFVMGDNRNESVDSRFWVNKFVHKKKIIGKVIFKYMKGFAWLDN